jgi:hypothetical protein
MRLKRAIKRIVALGTGATMVGATILGAMAAADLSDYPSPFVENGAFNALIVVGAAAKTEDVLGSIDVATSLQYSTTVTKPIPGTGTTVEVVGEGVKIATDSNKLTIGEALQSVKTNLDEDDLPLLLAKGDYVNDGDDESTEYEYTQKVEFATSDNASVSWIRDRDYTDEDNPYVMLYSPKSTGSGSSKTWFMRYTLDFSKDAESDHYSGTTCGSANEMCDFEDTKLEIMGVEYEVTKAEYSSGQVKWEMMGGVSLNTMYEGETKTFTVNGVDYEVTVDIISDTGSSSESVILTVNGESSKELFKDQTQKVAGIEIGIKQVMGNEAGEAGAGRDLVQFYIGAQKVVLTDADGTSSTYFDSNVKLGGTEVDDLYVDWLTSTGTDSVKIDKMYLTWAPSDEVFVTEEQPITFPGFESLKVEYAGLTSDGNEELVVFEPHGDDNLQLEAPLESGKTTVDVLYLNSSNLFEGYGETVTAGQGKLFVAASGNVYEGDYIVLTSSTERETHIVELDDVSSKNVTRLKDLADGTKYEGTCTSQCTINVGDVSAVFSGVSSSSGYATLAATANVGAKIYTKEGLTINLGDSLGKSAYNITVTEEDQNGVLEGGNAFLVEAGKTSQNKVHVESVIDSNAFETAASDQSTTEWQYGDTKDWGSQSKFGTRVVHDKSGDEYLVMVYYPGEEAHANVFVNSEAAVVTSGGGGGTYEEVQRIEVGSAVLDTEVASLTAQNAIVVGGPCVNNLAAQLMGNPADCAAGFEMGKAMIKLFEHDNGNVAMLVAGYSAMDTRRAARVVANYDSYDNFAGTELEVTGTSLTDISVGVPTPAEEVEEPAAEE